MVNDYSAVIKTPLPDGVRLGLKIEQGDLKAIDFVPATTPIARATNPVVSYWIGWLSLYFSDPRSIPPIDSGPPPGTVFQQRVWRRMREIECGGVLSYGEMARELDSAARAVAQACRRNPWAIVFPCHRVVARNGIGGFNGSARGTAVAVKAWLLDHERQ